MSSESNPSNLTKTELAIKVVNLRRDLEVANRIIFEQGNLGVLADEDRTPTFRESRRFWTEVRKLTGYHHRREI